MHRWDALRPERSTGNNSPSLTRTQRIAPKWLYPRTFDFEIHISAWILDHISHVQRVLKPQFHMHYRLSTSSWFMHCMSSPLIVVQYLIHVHGFLSRVGKLMSIHVQILWLTPSIKLHRYGKSTTIKSNWRVSHTMVFFFLYRKSRKNSFYKIT